MMVMMMMTKEVNQGKEEEVKLPPSLKSSFSLGSELMLKINLFKFNQMRFAAAILVVRFQVEKL